LKGLRGKRWKTRSLCGKETIQNIMKILLSSNSSKRNKCPTKSVNKIKVIIQTSMMIRAQVLTAQMKIITFLALVIIVHPKPHQLPFPDPNQTDH